MENNLKMCECGHDSDYHMNAVGGCNCGCDSFRPAPAQPSLKSPEDKIAGIIKEFREKFVFETAKWHDTIGRQPALPMINWLTQTLTTLLNEE